MKEHRAIVAALLLALGLSACIHTASIRPGRSYTVAVMPDGEVGANYIFTPDNHLVLQAPVDWGDLASEASYRILKQASQSKALGSKSIYVNPPQRQTPFEQALHQMLQSGLVEMGLVVAQKPEDTVKLDCRVQPVYSVEGMDVIVTTTIGNSFRYLFRSTDVYRVNPLDAKLYDAALLVTLPPPITPTKTIPLAGERK